MPDGWVFGHGFEAVPWTLFFSAWGRHSLNSSHHSFTGLGGGSGLAELTGR